MAVVRIQERVSAPSIVFRDRREAGERLAQFMKVEPSGQSIVLGLPRGGIPVGEPIAEALGCPLVPVIARKLPVPTSPEMGFGAVAIDGTLVLNERLVEELRLSQSEIDSIAGEVRREIERRAREYTGDDAVPEVRGRGAYLVDDGLATGYSMIAAARMVRGLGPESLILSVPVSPADSIRAVERHFDAVHCLVVQEFPPFAVASYYRDFHDMSDNEVREVLSRSGPAR